MTASGTKERSSNSLTLDDARKMVLKRQRRYRLVRDAGFLLGFMALVATERFGITPIFPIFLSCGLVACGLILVFDSLLAAVFIGATFTIFAIIAAIAGAGELLSAACGVVAGTISGTGLLLLRTILIDEPPWL